jgi:hypothetical protein
MSFTLILVGYYSEIDNEKYYYSINENISDLEISQEILKNYFLNLSYNETLFHHINFFCENKNLKKCNIKLNEGENKKIHVFTANMEAKHDLIVLFQLHGDRVMIKSKEEIMPELSEDELNMINKKSIILFQDEDFKKLVQIYKNKPEIFKIFYQYISSGNIIENSKTNIDISENLKIIQELDLNFTDENITEALTKTGNHLNLSLRYLLFNYS